MSKPLISIIIPSYNRATLIKETLQSVVTQSSADWQCIVVDDGSTDETIAVVSAFAKADSRIQLLQRDDTYASGGNGARQMGLDHVHSNWVMFLDSDDMLAQYCVENRLQVCEEALDMVVFHTGTFKNHIGDHDILWNILQEEETIQEYMIRFLSQDMPWHTTGVLWSTAFLKRIEGWNQELTAWQDWELHIRALTYSPNIKAHTGKPDNYYRLDVAGSIATKKKSLEYIKTIKNAIKLIEEKVLEVMPTLKQHLQYLIYRNLIANPIKWKRADLPQQVLTSGIYFKTVSKRRFIYAYWRERFFAITLVKRFLKHKLKFSYYTRLHPQTTFLKKKF
jgi:glycosyltransferase involved in cell wall biosynthesis